jgi:FkbM family methyltransferase
MPGARQWISGLFLRVPAPLRSMRRLPIIGDWMHRVSHAVLPADQRHWAQIQSGPAEGLWFELNPRTGEHYLRGEAEEPVQEAVAQRLRPGMIFYDLGANIGLFSLLAARAVGPEGRVFSFEPDPKVAARLRRNVARNGFSKVTICEMGVWSSSGEMSFVAADAASPDRGTGRFIMGNSGDSAPLQCVALDEFVADHPAPDAIKCDVEGAELEVLRGAENLIQESHPWILGEMHSDANARAWQQSLGKLGYKFEFVDASHILATM